jgi:autotransporter passenger strand-loop-strand repeat protein
MAVQVITSGLTPVSPEITGLGDYLVVLSGGTALSAAIAGGTEELFGVDSNTTLGQQGFQGISSGGTAVGTTVAEGATETVRTGGTALHATIGTSGFQIVSSGGLAQGTVLSSGGYQIVSARGVALSTTIAAGGTEILYGSDGQGRRETVVATQITVARGGTAIVSAQSLLTSADIASGGVVFAYSGGTVSGVEVTAGGYLVAAPGATLTAISGAPVISTGIVVTEPASGVAAYPAGAAALSLSGGGETLVLSGGTLQDGRFADGGDLTVFSGGSTLGVTLSGSFEAISSGGFASGTVLDQGAVQYVFSGGAAAGTVVNSGISIVDYGGTALGTVVGSGANQTIDGTAVGTTVAGGGLDIVGTVISSGSHDLAVGGSAVAPTIGSGGYAFVYSNGTISDATIQADGYVMLSFGGVAVDATVDSGGTLAGLFGRADDTTVGAGGLMLLFNGETDSGTTVDSGGTLIALPGGRVMAPNYEAGATVVSAGVVTVSGVAQVLSYGATASAYVLGSGMSNYVYAGGSESGTVIGNGASSLVDGDGTATDTTIAGGGLLFIGATAIVSGAITFAGSGGTLNSEQDTLSGVVISGFAPGDTIGLALPGTDPTATLTAGNVLEVANGSSSATLQLDPRQSFTGDTFTAALTPDGRTTVGVTAPAAAADAGSVAGNAQPVDIPLYVVPVGDGYDGYRVGIEVSFDGGAHYQMDLFDTGAPGLYAAYNPALWSSYAVTDPQPQLIFYGSGDAFTSQAVSTNVTLQTTSGTPLTLSDATVGLIDAASNPGSYDAQGWNGALTASPSIGPFANGFYGDFGADLMSNDGLDALLPQFGAGLSNGFIVSLGAYPNGGTGQIGVLQVGLTQADIAAYSTVIPMQGQDTVDTFPQSGQPTYAQDLGSGTLTLSNSSGTYTAPSGFLYDTGNPTLLIEDGTVITDGGVAPFVSSGSFTVSSGTSVVVDAAGAGQGGSGWTLGFSAGSALGLNEAGVELSSSDSAPGDVNVGLNAYFGQSVMFDVADGRLGFEPIPCFAEGTRLRTPRGDVPVERLRVGDEVLTLDGTARPIRWIGHRHVDCRRHPRPEAVQPIRIRRQAFGAGLPVRDLILSPDHALFLEGVLIPVKYLVDGEIVARMDSACVTYHHLELDRHDVILAEGLPAETYLDTGRRAAFAHRGGVVQAHPVFAPEPDDAVLRWEAAGYAPLAVTGPAVDRARARLDARREMNEDFLVLFCKKERASF